MRYTIIAGTNRRHIKYYSETVETLIEAIMLRDELRKQYRFAVIYDEMVGKEVRK